MTLLKGVFFDRIRTECNCSKLLFKHRFEKGEAYNPNTKPHMGDTKPHIWGGVRVCKGYTVSISHKQWWGAASHCPL